MLDYTLADDGAFLIVHDEGQAALASTMAGRHLADAPAPFVALNPHELREVEAFGRILFGVLPEGMPQLRQRYLDLAASWAALADTVAIVAPHPHMAATILRECAEP